MSPPVYRNVVFFFQELLSIEMEDLLQQLIAEAAGPKFSEVRIACQEAYGKSPEFECSLQLTT